MNSLLYLDNVSHAYGRHAVVDRLSFGLNKGDIGCLLGPSGCGKTTVLRCIAGFEAVSGGEILLDGVAVSSMRGHVPPEKRKIGMVFQDYALFPHLNVEDNISFGLQGAGKAEKAARTAELLALVGLPGQERKFPHELSGGQQQRVALARALAPNPRLLLMDEPFSNLDVDLRERLSVEVRDIIKAAGTTAILVTHDQHEAFAMADQIGIMSEGRIQQWDTPYNLYHRPANRFVADFIGQGVFAPGTVLNEQEVKLELGTQEPLVIRHRTSDFDEFTPVGAGYPVDVLLRPDDLVHDDASPLQAKVLHKAFRGAEILYTLELPGGLQVLSLVPSHHNHALGEDIGIRLDVDHVVVFPTSGRVRGELPAKGDHASRVSTAS
ncbi:ABC transporter ATP-binding protein [Herbaspirillum sp. HC18]|nr:ABC transporter ATP-binding protein [Herbaspirillum sp. HC18]